MNTCISQLPDVLILLVIHDLDRMVSITIYICTAIVVLASKSKASDTVIHVEPNLRWELVTTSVVLGKDARLTCHSHVCPYNSIKKWFGGNNYDLLCFNGYSANPEKYAMMSNHSGQNFDLMIKNFSLTDTNCSYTCACGLLQYTKMLELNEFNLIYPPRVLRYSNRTDFNLIEIEMSMTVYPLPTCEISFEDILIPTDITVEGYELEGGMELYQIKILQKVDMERYSCKVVFNISCTVGTLDYTLHVGQLDLCKGNENLNDNSGIISASVIISVTVFILLVFLLYKLCRSGEVVQKVSDDSMQQLKIFEEILLNKVENDSMILPDKMKDDLLIKCVDDSVLQIKRMKEDSLNTSEDDAMLQPEKEKEDMLNTREDDPMVEVEKLKEDRLYTGECYSVLQLKHVNEILIYADEDDSMLQLEKVKDVRINTDEDDTMLQPAKMKDNMLKTGGGDSVIQLKTVKRSQSYDDDTMLRFKKVKDNRLITDENDSMLEFEEKK